MLQTSLQGARCPLAQEDPAPLPGALQGDLQAARAHSLRLNGDGNYSEEQLSKRAAANEWPGSNDAWPILDPPLQPVRTELHLQSLHPVCKARSTASRVLGARYAWTSGLCLRVLASPLGALASSPCSPVASTIRHSGRDGDKREAMSESACRGASSMQAFVAAASASRR